MPDERCKHELPVAQCIDCAPVPPGLTGRVFTTQGGQVFHRIDNCAALHEGQRHAHRRGQELHPAVNVPLSIAMGEGRAACINCFPDYRPGTAESSAVRSDRHADADHLAEVAATLKAASRAVAAALAADTDRRKLTDIVAAALIDIRAQVWPHAATPVLPQTAHQPSDVVQRC